jgi:hypothetical protein
LGLDLQSTVGMYSTFAKNPTFTQHVKNKIDFIDFSDVALHIGKQLYDHNTNKPIVV